MSIVFYLFLELNLFIFTAVNLFILFLYCFYIFLTAVQHERLPRKISSVHPQIIRNNIPQKMFFNQSIPGLIDFGLTSPPPILPGSPFYFEPLCSTIPSPIMMSPTLLSGFSRFSLFHQAPPPTTPVMQPIQTKTRADTTLPYTKQFTPPDKKSPPPSPVTPLSKKSAEYSIDSLLKVTNEERTKSQTLLTPPTSPYQQNVADAKYNERVQQSLLRILETSISLVHAIPAFHNLASDLQSNLLEEAWMQVFLLGIHEAGFPLETLTIYLQNVFKVTPGAVDAHSITKLGVGLQKFREIAVDTNELAYLKVLALFDPCKYFL